MNVSLTAADLRTVGLTKADPVQSPLATVWPNIGPVKKKLINDNKE